MRCISLLVAALFATGCCSAVAEEAALSDLLGRVDLAGLADVAALPDGSFVALLTGDDGALVALVPGDSGPTAGRETGIASYADGEVHVADDGTVVALGPVVSGERRDVVLIVLRPGADQAEVVPVAADPDLGTPDDATGVLFPDGRTLYASLAWDTAAGSRLATVDVATGTVTASAGLQVDAVLPPVADGLALRPDGGVAALVHGRADGVALAEYDADLRLVGEPVGLADDLPEATGTGTALQVLADGTVLAAVALTGDRGDAELVTVRDGEVLERWAAPGHAAGIAVAAGERLAYLSYTGREHGAAVAAVDLATGALVADVVLCESLLGSAADLALAPDANSLVAGADCAGEGTALYLLD
ncbi:hypothetical protein SAMN04488107_2510 [Geodermatophilus saharensis]|uniref:Uncharacterized protein n=1 Tax=Geodermatophilus saharensis TaxID=1137994 RepID=A0A239EE93_9ACTN|nr:hypothetical protein [Geodermatophilus saharensis]SNS42849.1 hypothetical protein SAMN04488107_2510 [Geodermatophilus saharensis]